MSATPLSLDGLPELFRQAASIGTEYATSVRERRVAPLASDILAMEEAFGEPLPQQASDPMETIRLLAEAGSAATTATTGGRFFGLVVGGSLPVSTAAGWVAGAWDQVVFNQATSPIGVHLETVTSRWVLDLLGFQSDCSVGFVTGATMANFTCLSAARTAIMNKLGHDVVANGMYDAPRLRVVASDQVHVTVRKALSLLGFGADCVETVETDDQGRLLAELLPPLDERTIVIAQAGNVSSGSFDPLEQICDLAETAGAWVHVDGAFGLWAAASPELTHLTTGIERANSWATDTHKWLNTPYDCGLAICRDAAPVHQAMATQAPYLPETGQLRAPKDMVPEFSRRARAVEVWAALRSLGREGVGEMLEQTCRQARLLADGLASEGLEILNDVVLNQVLAVSSDAPADAIAHEVQASGEAWFGATNWNGQPALRFSVSSWATTDADIERTVRAVARAIRAG